MHRLMIALALLGFSCSDDEGGEPDVGCLPLCGGGITEGCVEEGESAPDGPQFCPDFAPRQFCDDEWCVRDFGLCDPHTDTVSLTNLGNETLEITSVLLLGDDRCSFEEPQINKTTIPPGEAAFVQLTYVPQTAGSDTVGLVVEHNGFNFNSPTVIPVCVETADAPDPTECDCPKKQGCGSCVGVGLDDLSDTAACANAKKMN